MRSPESLRVLIIDDNPADREVYRRLLLKAPDSRHEVLEAESGEEGLALCWSAQPDCVLLDYQLPDLDGLDFLAELNRERAVPPVPVVMLTGQGNAHVDEAAMHAGAQDYLVKGETDIGLLMRTIRHAIERHQLLTALRDSEARVRAVLETAADGVLTFDRQGFIVSCNRAAEPIFGCAAAEIVGQPVRALLPDLLQEVPALSPARRTGTETVRAHLELQALHRRGESMPIEITLSETRWGEERMFTAIVRDISERKRAEQAHRLFLAATSHDVRNALATILGYAHIVKTASAPSQADRALKRITGLVQSLSTVMNDIVVHAGAHEEQLVLAPLEVRSLVASAAKDLRSECRDRNLELRTELPEECVVISDRTALSRILQNLLNNAVRYTPQGRVLLRCEVTPSELVFTVRDTGIGIPARDLPRIFDEHYRHSHAREVEPLGTGLGLFTVKRLCEALGGTISVESQPGRGSTFTAVIPRYDAC